MRSIFFLVFIITATISSAQKGKGIATTTGNGVVKAYAFSKQIMPGNIMVDEQGNPMTRGPRTQHLIVVETKGKLAPAWKTANINGKIYNVSAFPLPAAPHEVGAQKDNERRIVITPIKGNKLWQLELEPQDGQAREQNGPNTINQIVLNGLLDGKKIIFKIDREVELFTYPSY